MKKKIFSKCIYNHTENSYHDKHHTIVRVEVVKLSLDLTGKILIKGISQQIIVKRQNDDYK